MRRMGIHPPPPADVNPGPNPPSVALHNQNVAKFTCHIIGDSHVRGLNNILSPLLPGSCSVQTLFHPGAGFHGVSQSHSESPHSIEPSPRDPVIVICGTNYVCTTPWEIIQKSIDEMFERFSDCQCVCLVAVPFRYDNTKLNFHIRRLNGKINHYIKLKNNCNMKIMNPNKFLKPKDYAIDGDGIHLNRFGKSKHCLHIKKVIMCNEIENSVVSTSSTMVHPLPQSVPTHESLHCDDLIDLEYDYDSDWILLEIPRLDKSQECVPSHSILDNTNTEVPTSSLLDTPSIPTHVNNLIKNKDNASSDYYKLAHLSCNFSNNAVFSSPIPVINLDSSVDYDVSHSDVNPVPISVMNESTSMPMPIRAIEPQSRLSTPKN
uniref:Uncharacterized protein n=1 Tax=Cacopsylla melanoneura TaxID=428564 RepID=A0A8D8Z611_9HEMI